MNLTFNQLRAANVNRLPQFKNRRGEPAHTHPLGHDWSPADWMVAMVGEVGEAASVMKQLRRGDFDPKDYPNIMRSLAKELADIQTYLDLLALRYGFDLGEETARKFNEVSVRVGADVFIEWDRVNGACCVINAAGLRLDPRI